MKTDLKSLEQLQQIFKDRWGIQLNIYENNYSRVDCWFEFNGKKYDVEVKKRRFNSGQYPTTIINEDKFVELHKKKAILVCMFDDKFGICKNVDSAYLKTTSMLARTTTDWGGDYKWSNKVELNLTKFNWYEY